ncbi:MAG: HEAT repeat domain-containing protein [Sedimentisphaerales bacterium]|nr:HEAT repeat domain-containing protein [Sedimentisphaerales bacterium]
MSTEEIRNSSIALVAALLLAGTVQLFGQTVPPATKEQEAKLIAVLTSDSPQKEKVDACRQLSVIGTQDAVAPLAALLGDEKLSHMARYALEPIPDPAVDEALRDALGKLKGRPLVGVIISIGVRRDTKAVPALGKMLRDSDEDVAQAAARALGRIGDSAAAKALQAALPNAPAANQFAFCEGLFRCAEALAAKGQRGEAIAIYDQLRSLKEPHQVRTGAVRGAILARGKDGLTLLREYLHSGDYLLFSAAVQAAMELPRDKVVTEVLTAEIAKLPADNQILVIQTLGKRADPAALPALFALAKGGDKTGVRLAAIRALSAIGHASAVPVLVGLFADADRQISEAARESLAGLPGEQTDAAVMAMFNSGDTSQRLTALELIGRRRMTASVPTLLKAAGGADPQVRPAAIRMVGELGGPDQLPVLLDLLMGTKATQDVEAAEQALSDIFARADNPQSYTDKITGLLAQAQPAQKGVLLRILSTIGGPDALKAVRAAVDDPNAEVRAAAIRALSRWKGADAAPDLLRLAKTSPDPSGRIAALRGYIGLVRDESLSTENKLAMCKEAAAMIQRDEEKKLLLGVLGEVPAVEALSMAMAHLSNPATKDEAAFAAVAIGEKIFEQKPGEVADAVAKVMQVTGNKDVVRRAKAILNKARKASGTRVRGG